MASIISDRSGTKTVEVLTPRIRNPVIVNVLLFPRSLPKSIDGPIKNVARDEIQNEANVM